MMHGFFFTPIPIGMKGRNKTGTGVERKKNLSSRRQPQSVRPPMSIWIMPNAIKNIKIPHPTTPGWRGADGGHRTEDTKGL